MKLTLIITTFNRPDFVIKALLSAAAQSRPPDEVVLADDGSKVDMLSVVREHRALFPFPITFVTQEDIGFRLARSRNNGARAATGELLVFTDQDIVFTRGYLKTFVDNARKGEFLVSSPVRLGEVESALVDEAAIKNCDYSAVLKDGHLGPIRKQYRKDFYYRLLKKLHLRPIGPKLRGGVCAIWREDFMAVNGYDENYKGWGNEDDDLGWRLHRYGVTGRNVTQTEVPIHLFHPTNIVVKRPNREYYKKRLVLIKKGEFAAPNGVKNPLDPDQPSILEL